MGFAAAVKVCFRKYFTFSGRASRPEYWWFVLFMLLGGILAAVLDGLLFWGDVSVGAEGVSAETSGPLNGLFGLVTLVPGLAAGWRRMHDSGRSGLFLLYPLIVLVGIAGFANFIGAFDAATTGDVAQMFTGLAGVVLALSVVVLMISPLLVIWWLTRPSQPGPNPYGPNPHEVAP
ncbi:DUF805 domain-containing protein [Rhodovulum sp. BSW8]|uniref:DUF805 domain-containing protein n=1 Tax=Rhodovulum visakhapatnamense TaxID=364297 RepID=A0A4R8FJ55_9RHOB|nr:MULTISPECIES: DUF805 domain-containing protein [Rhodovulum]OLS43472.1 DUF805 domain-containing protein [Rhodovulum sulfidophilum]MBL3570699.1 DUF805 domain-containing protein [Rhodovulum visakhapatnamense]MBL3578553.1 DUF805 domain-containing protein [Rhodovulum visakhapatnamense]RBO51314.1 DUF805 domain-containing protein [Rhodovulum sp. BSW8]TDX26149.1 uncharacterized membrane protein YhaH (DUF805 family) [Rhodovulum visakhapatnamense]